MWCTNKPSNLPVQLLGHLAGLGLVLKSCGEDTTTLRRALTAGLFPYAAKRQLDGGFGRTDPTGYLVDVDTFLALTC